MSQTKESAVLPTEEVTQGDLQGDGDAEETTPSQQADTSEQVEATTQLTISAWCREHATTFKH